MSFRHFDKTPEPLNRVRCRLKQSIATWLTFSLVVLVSATGCQDDSLLDRAPVTGVVTLDGKPLTQGVVHFTPERGRMAHGEIGPDGTFTMSTYGANDGAPVGKHQVSIIACEEEAGFESEVEPKWLIPRRYGSGETSGLTFEVKADASNEPRFELKSK